MTPPPKVKPPQSKPPQSESTQSESTQSEFTRSEFAQGESPKGKRVAIDGVGDGAGHSGFGDISSGWVTIGLLFVVVFLLGRVGGGFESPAMAEMAVNENGYTMMTTDGGSDEILVVIDSRQELLFVYRLGLAGGSGGGGVDLLEREPLNEVFERARAQALGTP